KQEARGLQSSLSRASGVTFWSLLGSRNSWARSNQSMGFRHVDSMARHDHSRVWRRWPRITSRRSVAFGQKDPISSEGPALEAWSHMKWLSNWWGKANM